MNGEFNGLILLGILGLFLSFITRAGRKPGRPESRSSAPPRLKPLPQRPDATQREGLRLETVLRDLRDALEQAAQPAGLPSGPVAQKPGPGQGIERSSSLELEPEVRSLEDEVRRPVDLDDEAMDIEARRIQAAAARNTARDRVEQPRLDKPRQEPADHTATRAYTAQQLRDAFVWREILGPPVSLRGE